MADRRENNPSRTVRVLTPAEQAHEMAQWPHDPNWPAMENRGSAQSSLSRKTGEYAKRAAALAKAASPAAYGFPENPKPVKIDSSKTMLGKEIK